MYTTLYICWVFFLLLLFVQDADIHKENVSTVYMGIYLKNLSFSVVYSDIVQTYIYSIWMRFYIYNKNNVIYFFFQFSCAIVWVYTNFYRYITTHQ